MPGAVAEIERSAPRQTLQRSWTFAPSRPAFIGQLSRLKSMLTGWKRPPPYEVLRPLGPAPRWTCYFLYLPDGRLTPAHRYTLERLRASPGRLLAICAAPSPEAVPAELAALVDALVWKGLSGYDFSAYALALRAVAAGSPGADLFIMNDSVLGPFADLKPLLAAAPWALTGFTASAMFENHLQSYAFQLRCVTDETVRALEEAMPAARACDRYRDVINLQESRFARIAARRMSVGAFWYAESGDPSLCAAQRLLDEGFPFLKRSLLDRHAHFQDEAALRAFLATQRHPL